MDHRLVAWARAVKARHRRRAGPSPPALWLFTDAARLPDPTEAVRALPDRRRAPGLCGVLFRHDGIPGRPALAARIARLCRSRGLAFVMTGPVIPGASIGMHRRSGRGRNAKRCAIITASAHDPAALVRARSRRADAIFLSPSFATPSHPGSPFLGPVRWARLARTAGVPVLALGGVTGSTAGRLPRWCAGAGAIGALSPKLCP